MQIRHSKMQDIEQMMKIYEYARNFMKENGNPTQWWEKKWPPKELIEKDILSGKSYVCIHENRIVGTFFFDYGKDIDPTYIKMSSGEWLNDEPYGVIHRIAGDGSVKGIGEFCILWAFEKCGHLRIDTHEDNRIMQNLVKKLGFDYRGIIHVEQDKYPRLAYEKIN